MSAPKWEFVMLHHSLTADSGTVSWGAIRRYHIETRGWLDIGYHFGVELVGDHYEIFLGRPLTMAGAHAYQQAMNERAIGICCVGNFDLAPPPEPQLAALEKLVRWLLTYLGKGPGAIVCHRDVAPKTCPGTQFDDGAFRSRCG